MTRILLIHGASHGAWCWRDTLPALTALGHEARAIDLPSHGDDQTPVGKVTLNGYGQAILDALSEPAVLVGHSMGGYAITQAAEMNPANVAGLIYLCAYTPWEGFSLSQMRLQAAEQPLLPAIRPAEDRLSFTFDPDMAPDLFYHDCPPETVRYAEARLCPQAVAPSATPLTLTARSHSLPRSYIVCKRDRAIPPDFQREMAARFDPGRVATLDSGHSPFFAMPETLAATIDRLVKA